jgi:tetratricopeptide (TPR) repeat protein
LRASKVALAHGRVQEAEASLQRVLHGNRNDPDALLALAEIYFDQGAYQKATKFAERAVASAPKRASARVMLADCYYKALRYEDARREYQRASDLGDRGAKTMLRRLDDKLSPP